MTCHNLEIWTGGFLPKQKVDDAMSGYFEGSQKAGGGRIHSLPALLKGEDQQGYMAETIIPRFLEAREASGEHFIFIPVAYGEGDEKLLLTIHVKDGIPTIETTAPQGWNLDENVKVFRTNLILEVFQTMNLHEGAQVNPDLKRLLDFVCDIEVSNAVLDQGIIAQLEEMCSKLENPTKSAVQLLIWNLSDEAFTQFQKGQLIGEIEFLLEGLGQEATGCTIYPQIIGEEKEMDVEHAKALTEKIALDSSRAPDVQRSAPRTSSGF